MAFIEKTDPVVLNIMLTSKGRELLADGALTFNYFGVGDSEIDYNYLREVGSNFDPFNSIILRPKDKNPQILSFVPKILTGDTYNAIAPIVNPYDVVNNVDSIGFFTNTGTTFATDSVHVKQPDIMVYVSGITGGSKLKLRKSPTYGISLNEPDINDFILVKWTHNIDTTGYTINKNYPTPHLMYQITNKTGTLSGNDLVVTVDRDLPNFSGYNPTGASGALVYYSSITITYQYATDYIEQSVIDFLQNYQCSIYPFPYWNMSIIFTEEIAGIQSGGTQTDRTFGQFKTNEYAGFVSYIQNQAPVYKKLGIIHYTNSSPANVYGEEFYLKTPILEIPTIMYHKSTGATLGLNLVGGGPKLILTGKTKSLNIEYYKLYDINDIAFENPVGKVFPGLKIFVIEDQELLFAMSYKSNRSWTLPDYAVGTGNIPVCP